MKSPRFEELAQRWQGKAQFYYVFSEEAHPEAAFSARLNQFADQVQAMDKNGDGVVTRAEFQGKPWMFDPLDVNHDGVLQSHEFVAVRRIDQFKDFHEPRNYDERVQAARRFRSEVKGSIPVVLDEMDNRTSKAYGGLPNSAILIGQDGRVKKKMAWAAANEMSVALSELTGVPAPPAAPEKALDLQPIAREVEAAQRTGQPVLVEFTALGCPACKRMADTTLSDPQVQQALGRFTIARLGVEHDDAWALFESLGMEQTPAFVLLGHKGEVRGRLQGAQAREAFLSFLEQ